MNCVKNVFVAPLAGAWIEITCTPVSITTEPVAPLAGAWIEMLDNQLAGGIVGSLPLRERGLK